MQVSLNKVQSKTSAFTLIEMIGVLAVIGILAALLVPKIFEAINNARINSTAVSIATIKTAVADHYAKFGALQSSNGLITLPVANGTAPIANFDSILVTEQLLDKTLAVRIADPTNTFVELVPIPSSTGNAISTVAATPGDTTANDWSFDLADTNLINDISGTVGVVIYLKNVVEADAVALNNLIDGPSLGVTLGNAPDLAGRVMYGPVIGGVVSMQIYVTHR